MHGAPNNGNHYNPLLRLSENLRITNASIKLAEISDGRRFILRRL
jgi:hypothetical protein